MRPEIGNTDCGVVAVTADEGPLLGVLAEDVLAEEARPEARVVALRTPVRLVESVTGADVTPESVGPDGAVRAEGALVRLLVAVLALHMSTEIGRNGCRVVTQLTSEWPLSEVNCSYVVHENVLPGEGDFAVRAVVVASFIVSSPDMNLE